VRLLLALLFLLPGCSIAQTLPQSEVPPRLNLTGASNEIFPTTCTDPKILKVCVKPGDSAKLGVELTCTRGGKKVTCGRVMWSTKASNAGLKGKFNPNPGNPTIETVSASRTIKKGHYSQVITARCGVPSCPKQATGAIWVI
jgi:hypothetical protein